jgi:hypothetical protein
MSHFIHSLRSIIQFLLTTGALISTFLATWIFYWSPWLHLSAVGDVWLARHRCWLESWCQSKVLIAPPLGVFFTLVALGSFTLAMWLEPQKQPLNQPE